MMTLKTWPSSVGFYIHFTVCWCLAETLAQLSVISWIWSSWLSSQYCFSSFISFVCSSSDAVTRSHLFSSSSSFSQASLWEVLTAVDSRRVWPLRCHACPARRSAEQNRPAAYWAGRIHRARGTLLGEMEDYSVALTLVMGCRFH